MFPFEETRDLPDSNLRKVGTHEDFSFYRIHPSWNKENGIRDPADLRRHVFPNQAQISYKSFLMDPDIICALPSLWEFRYRAY